MFKKNSKIGNSIFIGLILVNLSQVYGKKKIDVDLEGRLAVGMAYEFKGTNPDNLNPNLSYHRVIYSDEPAVIGDADVEFTIDASSFLRGRFELEADYNSVGVRMNECWVRFQFIDPIQLSFGLLRKVFGFEELKGAKSRSTIYRSFVNRYIQSFLVLERDPMLQLRIKQDVSGLNIKYYILTGADGDVRVFGNAAVWLEWENSRLGFSNLYTFYWDNSYSERSNSNICALSFDYKQKKWYVNSEIFWGLDPNASDLTRHFSKFQKIYFGAVKLLVKHNFPIKKKYVSGIEPVVSGTYIANYLKKPSKGYSEILWGLTVIFNTKKQVRWMTDCSAIYAHNYANVKIGRYSWKTASKVEIIW